MSTNNKIIDPMEDISNVGSKFIRPMQFEDRDKSFEEKIYIILYNINNIDEDDPSSRTFSVCVGRTMAYNDIKDKLISGLDIDVHRSFVMTETKQTETSTGDIKYYMVPYKDCMSVYAFCISISSFYSNDEFDIEDYANGDVPENRGLPITNYMLSPDQMEYRQMLEESLSRGKFLSSMREIYGNKDSRNV